MEERILLHICCGPCSLYCIDDLKGAVSEAITGYFANPNIHPYDEFMRRKGSTTAACAAKKISLLTEDNYDFEKWANFKSSRAERCKMCYTMRAILTARKAAELNYKYFTSTLFVRIFISRFQAGIPRRTAAGAGTRSLSTEILRLY